jgi:hypothetical protein
MGLTARLRLVTAAALTAGGLGLLTVELSVAGAGNPCDEAGTLCPNLETVEPGNDDWLGLDRRGKKGNRRLILRLSNRIANRGAGPLELRKSATTPQSCIDEAPDSDPDLSRGVVQRIFEDDPGDAGSLGYFDRDDDTEFSDVPIGCYFFHAAPGHNHWHFQDFAEYRLERLDGSLVADSTKVGFCVFDGSTPYEPPPPGMPPARHFPTGSSGCNDADDPVASQGLSIGYADIYTLNLVGQSIDITGAHRGKYCLVSEANPLPRIFEGPLAGGGAGTGDNARRVKIQIRPVDEFVRERPNPC